MGAGPDDRVQYAYILGASHSGSTLLAMLLNAHPDVVSAGEIVSGSTRDLAGYRCSCRRLIVECPFWQRVSGAVARGDGDFSLADFGVRLEAGAPFWVRRALRLEHRGRGAELVRDLLLWTSPAWRRRFANAGRHCDRLARALLEHSGARVLVDSSKLAHRLKLVRRMDVFDVKVVHLVRDGRAVALTYMDQQTYADAADPALRRGGRGGADPRGWEMPMARAADEWRRGVRAAEHALARLAPSQWIRVRYEDLCEAPERVLGRIFQFLGLDPARAARDFRAVEHHVVGNGMRLDSTSEIRLDERWRSALAAPDLDMFEQVAGPVNRRLGYR